eukprot:SAG11_NODE_2038_length_3892_cov_181.204587_2_plen_663_part_00
MDIWDWVDVPGGPAGVVEVLDHIKFPKQERLNISPDAVEGICLGISDGRGHGIGVSAESLDRPNLTQFLVNFADNNLDFDKHKFPEGFKYTCIQINKNPPQNCHIDKNNEGPSYIIGLGDYSHTAQDCYGGCLWIEGQGPVDIKNKWVLFDGNIPHGTIGNYVGTRYSLVYFTRHNYDRFGNVYEQRLKEGKSLGRKLGSPENFRRLTNADVDDEWDGWGFPYPEPGFFEKITYELPTEERKKEGKRLFELFMSEPRLPFIAIPSHERPELIKKFTLDFLTRHEYPMNMVYVFVEEGQIEAYKPLEEQYSGLTIVMGKLGIVHQRNAIVKYFKVGDKVVEMDDDIEDVYNIRTKVVLESFKQFVQENFLKIHPFRTGMWGLQGNLNNWGNTVEQGDNCGLYSLIVLVGYINDHTIHLTMSEKEDFERVLIYHTLGKPCLKRMDYGIKTKYWKNPGGITATHTISERIEKQNKAAELLKEKYPGLFHLKKRESGEMKGVLDIIFTWRKSTPEKDLVRYDDDVNDVVSDLAPQFEKLTQETQSAQGMYEEREVSGEYRMMPMMERMLLKAERHPPELEEDTNDYSEEPQPEPEPRASLKQMYFESGFTEIPKQNIEVLILIKKQFDLKVEQIQKECDERVKRLEKFWIEKLDERVKFWIEKLDE